MSIQSVNTTGPSEPAATSLASAATGEASPIQRSDLAPPGEPSASVWRDFGMQALSGAVANGGAGRPEYSPHADPAAVPGFAPPQAQPGGFNPLGLLNPLQSLLGQTPLAVLFPETWLTKLCSGITPAESEATPAPLAGEGSTPEPVPPSQADLVRTCAQKRARMYALTAEEPDPDLEAQKASQRAAQ